MAEQLVHGSANSYGVGLIPPLGQIFFCLKQFAVFKHVYKMLLTSYNTIPQLIQSRVL